MSDLERRKAGPPTEQRERLEQRLQQRNGPGQGPEIRRGSDTDSRPLSFGQQRMWFLNQLEPQSDAYHIHRLYRLIGALDISALEQSLQAIVLRHGALRTVFIVHEGLPMQVVVQGAAISLPHVDLTHLPQAEREAAAMEQVSSHRKKPFDLTSDLMIRALVLRVEPGVHMLSIVMHHIASDAWSMGIFRRELSQAYLAFAGGQAPLFDPLTFQYVDFAAWQRAMPQAERLEKQLSYWRRQLDGLAPLELPADRSRPAIQSDRGDSHTFALPPDLLVGLRHLSRRAGVTFFATMLAALYCLLQRYSGQDDIAIATVIANRRRPEFESLIGFLQNTLVLRADLAGDPPFFDLLARVRDLSLDAYDQQDIPFEKLLAELQPERDLSQPPFFRVLLSLNNTPTAAFELAGLEAEVLPFNHQTSKLDLSFYLSEAGAGLEINVEYSTDLFQPDTIRRMAAHYQELLASIVKSPEAPISRLTMLAADERELILETWNQTAEDSSGLPDLIAQFQSQVGQRPDEVAFYGGSGSMTLAELNRLSNRLAHYLLAHGVTARTRVGICLDRSLDVPVALLAILKVGGVYVPLDPSYPGRRLRFIVEDAGVTAVITESRWLPKLSMPEENETARMSFCLDELQDSLEKQSSENVRLALPAEQTAYIIYTSGSTGRPKGVSVAHRQILNRLAWMWRRYPFEAGEVGCQKTALNFVDSLWELLGYLLQGVPTVVIPDDALHDPRLLVDMLAAKRVTRLWLVPSLLRVILDTHPNLKQRLPNLRFWVSSGEVLTTALYQRFQEYMPGSTLYNLYGTSEIWDATWFDPHESPFEWNSLSVPIGRPISNVRAAILDDHGQPVPIGVAGELCIGGDGLADGYLNRPELTATKFTSLPWIDQQPAHEDVRPNMTVWPLNDRLYHTGDRARWFANGQIDFLGRSDSQVKLRGHRLELAEVETHLDRHPAVRQSVATVDQAGTRRERLVAYYVAHDGQAPEPGELSRFLQSTLPQSMIPSLFLPLADLPLTPSGKMDRRSLPAPDGDAAQITDVYTAPTTPIEEELAAIWVDVLHLPGVGIHDTFFDLGGHSLMGIQLFSRIEEQFGVRLPLSLLFSAPTVALMSKHLQGIDGERKSATLVPIQPNGSRPPFFCVHDFGGGVLGYADLANTLGSDYPFYALQAPGLEGASPVDTSIEAMASRYVSAVREVQPAGPYHLGGYCFGGIVAFEMARQLEAAGEAAALVAIMEGYAPAGYQGQASAFSPWRWQTVWRNIPYWLQDYWQLRRDGVRLRIKRQAGLWHKRLQQRLGAGVDINAQDVLAEDLSVMRSHDRQLMETHLSALRRYKPQPIQGKVTLFAARGKTISAAVFGSGDPEHGWGSLAEGGVVVVHVDGGHRNIHMPPNVPSLAAALRASYED